MKNGYSKYHHKSPRCNVKLFNKRYAGLWSAAVLIVLFLYLTSRGW